jgi:predicted unusual protein kinase regulating ubiquinone biosynthesis (AarF/ABC1/UbiB family)
MIADVAESPQVVDRRRYQKILWFFARAIIHVAWWDLVLGRLFFVRRRVSETRPERFRALSRRFRELAVEMGGVLIKLGQFLSSRVDVLPPEITEELAGLQDEVPAVEPEQIQAVLAAELGDISAHFSFFDPEPIAAASLGQAHRAWLAGSEGDGAVPVVVKVQRPRIEEAVRTDLAAVTVVARWVMRYRPIRRRADVPALIREFADTLWEELNYELEADNAERFGEMYRSNPDVVVPSVLREHSTARVLVLQDVTGIKITNVDELDAAGVDRSQVAVRLLDAYFNQILKARFFHADPHPGNLFVLPVVDEGYRRDGRPVPFRLSFVDFGMVGRIETFTGESLKQILVSVSQRDGRGLTAAYADLGFFLPGSDLERIAEAQQRLLDQVWGRDLLELANPDPRELQEFGREFRDILYEFPFQVPKDFVYLGRALGMLSGLASLLDPTINPWRLVERYGREIIRSREQRQLNVAVLVQLLRTYAAMPGQLQRVLVAAEEGRLRVQTRPDPALLRRLDRLDRQTSRPNLTVLAAALLLAGALLHSSGDGVLAIVAWVLAGLILIFSALRSL